MYIYMTFKKVGYFSVPNKLVWDGEVYGFEEKYLDEY